jgi:formate--tetrahydrofolate ligase
MKGPARRLPGDGKGCRRKMKDIDIAQQARVWPISEIAKAAGIPGEHLEPYGKYMAKISPTLWDTLRGRPDGRLVWTTAITPTPAGEGKTVTSIGLVQAFGKLGKKVMGALRQPSMGPVFGVKGGATGGGRSQVYPMWDIDLHFTGDIHAVGAAHNLLSAMVELPGAAENHRGARWEGGRRRPARERL